MVLYQLSYARIETSTYLPWKTPLSTRFRLYFGALTFRFLELKSLNVVVDVLEVIVIR